MRNRRLKKTEEKIERKTVGTEQKSYRGKEVVKGRAGGWEGGG